MDACGKFGEHEKCVRVARGAAESNFSFLRLLESKILTTHNKKFYKIYTFYLFGGKTEKNEVSKWKHWKFNIVINGIDFFFCISDNQPWHFLRWSF